MLGLVLTSGLIDSINPCAITLLLLFVATIFVMTGSRSTLLKLGVTYIAAIYITYLFIGLGILRATHLFGRPHFVATAGAWLIIVIGAINLKDALFPKVLPWLSTRITLVERATIFKYVEKATIPTAAIAGVLVGICEFPCSGGIYLAVLGLLSHSTTFIKGLGYLLIYNVMFVLPLVVILAFAQAPQINAKMLEWQEKRGSLLRLYMALAMIILGVVILRFYI